MSEYGGKIGRRVLRFPRDLLWIVGIAVVLVAVTIAGLRATNLIQIGDTGKGIATNGAGMGDVLVIITNSGSTNSPGYTLTINKDGSGSIKYEKGTWYFKTYTDKTFSTGTFDSSHLAAILAQIKDVGTIPSHGCARSISFGSTTSITYDGKTSSDISCLSKNDGKVFQDLRDAVQSISTRIQA
jgi:hypothetical protein